MAITELSTSEVKQVSGAGTKAGTLMTLGGAALALGGTIVAFTPIGAAIGGVLAIGGIGISALAYAYDGYADGSLKPAGAGGAGGGGAGAGAGNFIATRIPESKSVSKKK